MQRLRSIIVDDEPLARRLLRSMLSDLQDIDLVAECKNGSEAIAAVRDHEPDLMFLDVKMPGHSGFDVVKELQSDVMPMVIFCTAFQRYAIDAFDIHAVDYLLKPINAGRLQRSVARAVQRFQTERSSSENKTPLVGAIDEIARRVSHRSRADGPEMSDGETLAANRKLAIRDHEGTVLVSIDDIDWVDAAGDYMCVHVKGETHIMRSTLKNLMSRLDPRKFKRIHRSTIVNLERVVKATPLLKGEYLLDLDCDERLKVSRNYRQEIKMFLAGN